jgi:P27 family predicted phage terminase small subunit
MPTIFQKTTFQGGDDMGLRGKLPSPFGERAKRAQRQARRASEAHQGDTGGASALIEAPQWLNDAEKAIFAEVARLLSESGVRLASIDRYALAIYARSFEQWRDATSRLAVEGHTITTKRGAARPNPLIRVAQKALETAMQAGEKLGLSPASRARLPVSAPQTGATDDPWKQFKADVDLRRV